MNTRRRKINLLLFKYLRPFQRRLLKYQSKKHTTNHAIAQIVSKNEAQQLIKDVFHSKHVESSKIREIYARILALGKQHIPNMSPFNPPNGFYVWSVADHGSIHLQLLGRNVKEVILNLAHFVLQHAYQVEHEKHKYLYILTKKKLPVGKLFFAKDDTHRQKCLIARIGREKLLFHFKSKGLFIHVIIYCPTSIKSFLLSYFQIFEKEFANLCCISPLLSD